MAHSTARSLDAADAGFTQPPLRLRHNGNGHDAGNSLGWSTWQAWPPRRAEETSVRQQPAPFLSRFVVLQAIGAAAIAGLWIADLANKPFQTTAAPMCWIILAIGMLGMVCVALQRWQDVQWIATHVVRIGLLGTVVGLIIAFSAATTTGSTAPEDIKPMIAAVVSGMYVSLYATLLGIGANLWLKINMRLLGNMHG